MKRLLGLPGRAAGLVRDLPVSSQQRACHNAMIAATALTERRAEYLEVQEFLASLRAPLRAPLPDDRQRAAAR